ncbi:MAG: hypothetical protein CSA81_14850 [Acidobacteria bacterium]|nr:MAG: hypothetical protein CSA81_14850 [Acidobacteriota bacterium]
MAQKKPCIDYAYYYLSRFPKTEKELCAKLYEKKYTDHEVESALILLKKDGYVDDEQFARMYLESEVIKKGKPLRNIRGKLLQKGIDSGLLAELVAEYDEEIQEGARLGILREIDKLKARGVDGFDIAQKLVRKGYKIHQIKQALAEREED